MTTYFAQVREDNLIERQVIEWMNPRRMICIGSGGCTVFSLLNDEAEKIWCVDNNPAQSWLIELKRAAIMGLERDVFLQFIGVRPCAERMEIFALLRPLLSDDAAIYWMDHQASVLQGINRCGITEQFYSLISSCILEHIYSKEIWNRLFSCNDIGEQQAFFNDYFTRPEWITAMRILLGRQMHLQFFPSFLFSGNPALQPDVFFMNKFRHEITAKSVRNNYFLSQLILGEYLETEEGMPYYMTLQGFLLARKNMQKLEIVTSGIDECCKRVDHIDAFMLSNVCDWMTPEQCVAVMEGMASCRSASASVCIRNMFGAPDLVLFEKYGFMKQEERSRQMLEIERSMMYNHISLFTI